MAGLCISHHLPLLSNSHGEALGTRCTQRSFLLEGRYHSHVLGSRSTSLPDRKVDIGRPATCSRAEVQHRLLGAKAAVVAAEKTVSWIELCLSILSTFPCGQDSISVIPPLLVTITQEGEGGSR